MRTIPQLITDTVFWGGSAWLYVVEITPGASDTWSELRWADREIIVDGNTYLGGVIKSVGTISHKAPKLQDGGGVVQASSVTLDLADKPGANPGEHLIQTLLDDPITGRDLTIWLTVDPMNRIHNSDFEIAGAGTPAEGFLRWNDGAPNVVIRTSAQARTGTWSIEVEKGDSTTPFVYWTGQYEQGSDIMNSVYAYSVSGADKFGFRVGAGGLWRDFSLETWTVSKPVGDEYVVTPVATWTRYGSFVPGGEIPRAFGDPYTLQVELAVPTLGDEVFFDNWQLERSVQSQAVPEPSPYHMHRTGLVAADLLKVYKGEVRAPEFGNKGIKLATRTIQSRRHKDIPIETLTGDTDATFIIPPDNVGKPFPMSYGLIGTYWTDRTRPVNNASRCLLASYNNVTEEVRLYVDRPGQPHLFPITSPTNQQGIYAYNSAMKRFVQEYVEASIFNPGTRAWLADGANNRYTENAGTSAPELYLKSGQLPLCIYLLPTAQFSKVGTNWTNDVNIADGDGTTFATVTGGGATREHLQVHNENYKFTGEIVFGAYALMKCTLNVGSDWGLFREQGNARHTFAAAINNMVTFPPVASLNNVPWAVGVKTSEQGFGHAIAQIAGPPLIDLDRLDYWLETSHFMRCGKAGTDGAGDADFYEIADRIDVTVDLISAELGAITNGRKFNDTWGTRKTASNAPDNPVDILEGILRHELAVATADIDTALFDTALTDIGVNHKAAGCVYEIENSLSVASKLCYDHGLLYWVNDDGQEAVLQLKHGAAVKTIQLEDIAKDSLLVKQTKREKIYNKFDFHYEKCFFDDTYFSHLYCDRAGQDLGDASYATKCADSYGALGDHENPLTINFDWIQDLATAQKMGKFFVDWLSLARLLPQCNLIMERNLALENGDLVAFGLPYRYGISADKVFIVQSIQTKKRNGIRPAKFIEVKEP